jgi:hypothetical protein
MLFISMKVVPQNFLFAFAVGADVLELLLKEHRYRIRGRDRPGYMMIHDVSVLGVDVSYGRKMSEIKIRIKKFHR